MVLDVTTRHDGIYDAELFPRHRKSVCVILILDLCLWGETLRSQKKLSRTILASSKTETMGLPAANNNSNNSNRSNRTIIDSDNTDLRISSLSVTEELAALADSHNHAAHDEYCAKHFPGSKVIRDVILPENETHANRTIPKVIHMTSLSRCVTEQVYDLTERWKLPGYSVFFHDDQAVMKLLESYRPEVPNMRMIAACSRGGAGLADVWRYRVMYEYGGIYTDIDNLPGANLRANGPGIPADWEAVFLREKGGFPSQYFFANKPEHPVMFHTLHWVHKQLHELESVEGESIMVRHKCCYVAGFIRFLSPFIALFFFLSSSIRSQSDWTWSAVHGLFCGLDERWRGISESAREPSIFCSGQYYSQHS